MHGFMNVKTKFNELLWLFKNDINLHYGAAIVFIRHREPKYELYAPDSEYKQLTSAFDVSSLQTLYICGESWVCNS